MTPPSGASPPLFRFDGVSVVFDTTRALDAITLDVPDDGITAIVGPSGSGKSTLLRLCNRLEVPTSGTISFRGADLEKLDPLILRRRVGMVFQRPTPFGGTVRDNLRVAASDADDGICATALGRAGLDRAFLDRPAADLSGGEAQRACIARTLVTDPEALLMDEPTSALDEDNRLALERVARELADGGVPLIWVTHDLDQMRRIADRVVELDDGRLVAHGPGGGAACRVTSASPGLAASAVFVAVAALLSWREGLGLERSIVWAAIRAVSQLLLVGIALTLVLDPGSPMVLSWLWVVAMLLFAADVARRRAPLVPGMFGLALLSFAAAAVVTLGVLFGLRVFPLEARALVPLAGMMIGNSMTATVLAARRFVEELTDKRDEVEARLALGQPSGGRRARTPCVRCVRR